MSFTWLETSVYTSCWQNFPTENNKFSQTSQRKIVLTNKTIVFVYTSNSVTPKRCQRIERYLFYF